MKHSNGKYDLTIDDIHEIRVEHSKMTEKMTYEELKKYYDEQERIFNEKMQKIKDRSLQLV